MHLQWGVRLRIKRAMSFDGVCWFITRPESKALKQQMHCFKYRLPVASGVIGDPRWGFSDLSLTCPPRGGAGQAKARNTSLGALALALNLPGLGTRPGSGRKEPGTHMRASPLTGGVSNIQKMGQRCRLSWQTFHSCTHSDTRVMWFHCFHPPAVKQTLYRDPYILPLLKTPRATLLPDAKVD